jgi:hypothetical protein
MRGVRSCGSLPSSRERPAVATMVANQASDTARTPGSDAANRLGGTRFSRQPAKTRSPTRTTCNAWKPKCLQAGNANEPGGDAPACWPGANSGSPHKIETGTHDSEARYRTAEARVGQPDRIAANVVAANTIWIEDSIHRTNGSTQVRYGSTLASAAACLLPADVCHTLPWRLRPRPSNFPKRPTPMSRRAAPRARAARIAPWPQCRCERGACRAQVSRQCTRRSGGWGSGSAGSG